MNDCFAYGKGDKCECLESGLCEGKECGFYKSHTQHIRGVMQSLNKAVYSPKLRKEYLSASLSALSHAVEKQKRYELGLNNGK